MGLIVGRIPINTLTIFWQIRPIIVKTRGTGTKPSCVNGWTTFRVVVGAGGDLVAVG